MLYASSTTEFMAALNNMPKKLFAKVHLKKPKSSRGVSFDPLNIVPYMETIIWESR